jgi:hypothetical protein
MLLVLLIVAFWTGALLLVAGLCAAARVGDDEAALAAEAAPVALRETARLAHEPGEAPLRIAA